MSDRFSIEINGTVHDLAVPGEMPLLWAIRDIAGLTGTKYGCGVGVCGACTVLVDGAATRSCSLPVSDVGSSKVVTIEHIGQKELHPVQAAWVEHNVPQCGYCQPGFIMQIVDLLTNSPDMSDEDLIASLTNVCRCGTYTRMPEAIADARKLMQKRGA